MSDIQGEVRKARPGRRVLTSRTRKCFFSKCFFVSKLVRRTRICNMSIHTKGLRGVQTGVQLQSVCTLVLIHPQGWCLFHLDSDRPIKCVLIFFLFHARDI